MTSRGTVAVLIQPRRRVIFPVQFSVDTVKKLKLQIESKLGVPASRQSLSLGEHLLSDDDVLEYPGLKTRMPQISLDISEIEKKEIRIWMRDGTSINVAADEDTNIGTLCQSLLQGRGLEVTLLQDDRVLDPKTTIFRLVQRAPTASRIILTGIPNENRYANLTMYHHRGSFVISNADTLAPVSQLKSQISRHWVTGFSHKSPKYQYLFRQGTELRDSTLLREYATLDGPYVLIITFAGLDFGRLDVGGICNNLEIGAICMHCRSCNQHSALHLCMLPWIGEGTDCESLCKENGTLRERLPSPQPGVREPLTLATQKRKEMLSTPASSTVSNTTLLWSSSQVTVSSTSSKKRIVSPRSSMDDIEYARKLEVLEI